MAIDTGPHSNSGYDVLALAFLAFGVICNPV